MARRWRRRYHDGYLMKPIDIPQALETIRQLLKIEWRYETDEVVAPRWQPETGPRPPVRHVEELIGLGQIGYVKGIQVKLDEIGSEYPEHADFVVADAHAGRPLRSRSVHGDPEDAALL